MKKDIPLVWLEPTDQASRYLRRYEGAPQGQPLCPGKQYHDSTIELSRQQAVFETDNRRYLETLPLLPKTDERWPTKCDHCDHVFSEKAHYQHGQHLLYRRSDNGELVTLHNPPVGAMWDAWWYEKSGPDGICLVINTPGGEWLVDGKASNCNADKGLKHYCWPRTGDPRNPQGNPPLNVASNGGCKVGAGSIGMEGYHGFLDNGYLRDRRL